MTTFLLATTAAFYLFNYNLVGPVGVSSVGLIIAGILVTVAPFGPGFQIRRRDFWLCGAIVFVLMTIAIVGVGHLVCRSASLEEWNSALSWALLSISFLAGLLYRDKIPSIPFSRAFGILSIVLSAFVSAYVLVLDVDVASTRFEVNAILPGGINGFVYGLFVAQAIYFAGVYLHQGRARTGLDYAVAVVPLLCGILLGSRQYLGGLLLWATILAVALSGKLSRSLALAVRGIFTLSFVVGLLLQIELVRLLILARVASTMKQIEYGSGRLEKVDALISAQDSGNWLGQGPGAVHQLLGGRADNFYLEFAIDYGNLMLILLLLALAAIGIRTFPRIRTTGADKAAVVIWGCVVVTAAWFAQFNELIREHILWMLVGSLVGRRLSRMGGDAVGAKAGD